MTTFQRFALLFFFGFFFAVGCVLSFTIGRHTAPKCEIIQTDTVFVTTTTHYDNPEPSDVLPAGFELIRVGTVAQLKQTIASLEEAVEAATVVAEARDSPQAEPPVDSAQVEIPLLIERKIYGGKEGDEYRAVVSGYSRSWNRWTYTGKQSISQIPLCRLIRPGARPASGWVSQLGRGSIGTDPVSSQD